MDLMPQLAYEHLLFLRVYPATMFPIPTFQPLYHVKMDDNKTKTLCTIHHKLSSYYRQTLRCVARHQSILVNTQWLVAACPISHFNSNRRALQFYVNHQLQPNLYLFPLTTNNYLLYPNSTQILKSKFNKLIPFPINQLLATF